jgi:hypothetical protein
MTVYHCSNCAYISEVLIMPVMCERCYFENIAPLTLEEIMELIDTGKLLYCPCCKHMHSGAV